MNTHVSSISRLMMHIVLIIVILDDLEVKAGDILIIYLQAQEIEKVWVSLRSHLAMCMELRGHKSFWMDHDLWMRAKMCPDDKVKYWSYIPCFIDGILFIHHNEDSKLQCSCQTFPLKQWYDDTSMHLGAKFYKTTLNNWVWTWAMSLRKYVKELSQK